MNLNTKISRDEKHICRSIGDYSQIPLQFITNFDGKPVPLCYSYEDKKGYLYGKVPSQLNILKSSYSENSTIKGIEKYRNYCLKEHQFIQYGPQLCIDEFCIDLQLMTCETIYSDQVNPQRIGISSTTGECLQQDTPEAKLCSQGFCIDKNSLACVSLNPILDRVGIENKSSICLGQNEIESSSETSK